MRGACMNENVSETLTINDIKIYLKIGTNAAYKLVANNPPFKVIKIGSQYRISSKSFLNWFEG